MRDSFDLVAGRVDASEWFAEAGWDGGGWNLEFAEPTTGMLAFRHSPGHAAAAMSERTTSNRLRTVIRGAVQGVGFRPFIHRLAGELGLVGWVCNTGEGVVVEVEGGEEVLRDFLLRIEPERPVHSIIQSLEPSWLEAAGFVGFEIRPSPQGGPRTALVLPDISSCPDCLREVFDPGDRRHLYPFTNCTHCGPRFTIIEALPYDRSNTSMAGFTMCKLCRGEYEDPESRRFHAQPNACPECGPQLELWAQGGEVQARRHDALEQAVGALRDGRIVAVKGLGGFHLMVRADDESAVARLRERKRREEKPFALMVPSVEAARDLCEVSELEERLLVSPEAPIVLMRRRDAAGGMVDGVAPGIPQLGLMLPSNPLHHIMMRQLGVPLVATSGNLSDEPICTDDYEALDRLGGIADLFLVHDRPIVRHVDDSIVRVLMGREMVLRRARGYAPLPVPLPGRLEVKQPLLAVGPHLKNTVAVATGGRVMLSQHLGDLETEASCEAFESATRDLQQLFDAPAARVVADLHPDYVSSRFAEASGLPVMRVQHHHAHVLACLAENGIDGPALGIAWDGTGYGTDGTIWGGEFLSIDGGDFERVAHLRTFPLPGGDAAAREPRRSLAGALWEIGEIERARPLFRDDEFRMLVRMLERGINTATTSSAGRLIDAVAALLGVRAVSNYEAQSAMELEFLAASAVPVADLPGGDVALEAGDDGGVVVDWEPWLRELAVGMERGLSPAGLAAWFHGRLVAGAVAVAERVGREAVALSGGCFQNRLLLEGAVGKLRAAGFRPCWHQRVPANDGGVALGQAVAGSLGRW